MRRGARRLFILGLGACLAACALRRPTVATVRRCVDEAEADRRACFQDCEGWYEEAFVGCYGGHGTCTDRCRAEQLACQAGPLADLKACGEAADNPASCQTRLGADRAACAAQPDRAACEDEAQRRAAACWQTCQSAQAPALERCARTFKACLEGCLALR
jgi:hypothetical protein